MRSPACYKKAKTYTSIISLSCQPSPLPTSETNIRLTPSQAPASCTPPLESIQAFPFLFSNPTVSIWDKNCLSRLINETSWRIDTFHCRGATSAWCYLDFLNIYLMPYFIDIDQVDQYHIWSSNYLSLRIVMSINQRYISLWAKSP